MKDKNKMGVLSMRLLFLRAVDDPELLLRAKPSCDTSIGIENID